MEEFHKFGTEMAAFRTWLEKAYKILEDKERQLANLNKVQAGMDEFKAFVSDVMTHGADLKFLTISGQKFVDLSKVGGQAMQCNIFSYRQKLLPHSNLSHSQSICSHVIFCNHLHRMNDPIIYLINY